MTHRTVGLLALVAILAGFVTRSVGQDFQPAAEPVRAVERRGTHVWIERPWSMRYIVAIVEAWPIVKKVATERNVNQQSKVVLGWAQIFEPVTVIPIPGQLGGRANLSVVVIEFDEQGTVLTEHTHGSPLHGRLNRLQQIVLSAGEGPTDLQYQLGHWFTGLGDISTHWAPGLCSLKEQPSPFSKTDTAYLYGPKFEISEFGPTFGCREWAFQLYDDERPYIDVTSYVRAGKTYPQSAHIKDAIGWARFGDKKPVIGQHEGRWYCLHDCPDGKPAGAISDIKRWAVEKGWRVPRPPTKAPTFPDPPAVQGTYRK